MNTTLLKQLGVGALGLALIAAPTFALAKDDSYRPRSVGSPIEVILSENGKAVVRGAKVTDVSGSTIAAQTIMNGTTINWTVRTDSDTDFVVKNGSESGIDAVADGDYVSFSGVLAASGSFAVDADVVRNWSAVAEGRTVVVGTVTHISDNDFTLSTSAKGSVEVETTSSTKYAGSIDAFSDIAVGTKVVAYGSYDAGSKTLTATQIAVDAKAAIKDMKDKVKEDRGNWGQWLKNFVPQWFSR